MRRTGKQTDNHKPRTTAASSRKLLRQLVAHLRRNRAQLSKEWAERIRDAKLLRSMSRREIFSEARTVYDSYLGVLETGSVKALQAYAQDLSERIVPRGVETREVLEIVLLLRDVLARSLFKKYRHDFKLLERVLDAYEPAANRIANTVGVSFVEERERVIREQQKAMQILHVQEEERKRISRELHDEVGQALAAINTHLALVQRECVGDQDAELRTGIADVEKVLVGAIERMHSFARALRSAALDDLGLLPALRSYLKDYAERTGLLVRFERSAKDAPLNAEQKTALFRIAQESLANVAKHAQATEVVVTLGFAEDKMQLRIKDNGKGFVVSQQRTAVEKNRLGLLGMQERARLVNGRCLVQSAPGCGTTVMAEIPLAGASPSVSTYTFPLARNEGSRAC